MSLLLQNPQPDQEMIMVGNNVLSDEAKKVLNEYMQVLKNSGYNSNFRREILKAGISGYQKILEDDRLGKKPLYRSKEWRSSARRMEKKNKKRNWLGAYKSCVFVPPTPNSELKQLMQAKEVEMRPGGREKWPIK